MKYKVSRENVQSKLKNLLLEYPTVFEIVKKIEQKGGVPYFVGGVVRDLLLGLPVKDLDIEVHGIPLDHLQTILSSFGTVMLVGKQYGVLRIAGFDVDWSVPRIDASGRHPQVVIDPYMDIKQAFARRDLTINAMGLHAITGELIDPFDGLDDLKNRILRAPVAESFVEDPLRFFRVMQFIGRFEMHPDAILNETCKRMEIASVSKERIEGEFTKLLLKSKKPSLGIEWLARIKRLEEILPELADCQGIPQNPEWHSEGDIFDHTKQVLDAAAILEYEDEQEKLIGMYAALCNDLGKAITTCEVNSVIRSIGPAQKGVTIAQKLLHRITDNKKQIDAVTILVQHHRRPLELIQCNAKPAAYKRLALDLAPHTSIAQLAKLAMADKQGRNPIKGFPLEIGLPELSQFVENARSIGVLYGIEKPLLTGRDLMPEVSPGQQMGILVKRAYEIQINKDIQDKDVLKKLVLHLSNTSSSL